MKWYMCISLNRIKKKQEKAIPSGFKKKDANLKKLFTSVLLNCSH